jgi:hypothetical protein
MTRVRRQGDPAAYPSFQRLARRVAPLRRAALRQRLYCAPGAPFTAAIANTVGLYHFDEGPAGAHAPVLLRDERHRAGRADRRASCAYGGARRGRPGIRHWRRLLAASAASAHTTPTATAGRRRRHVLSPPADEYSCPPVTRTPTPTCRNGYAYADAQRLRGQPRRWRRRPRLPTPVPVPQLRVDLRRRATMWWCLRQPGQSRRHADGRALGAAGGQSRWRRLLSTRRRPISGWSLELNAGRPCVLGGEPPGRLAGCAPFTRPRLVAGTVVSCCGDLRQRGGAASFVNGQASGAIRCWEPGMARRRRSSSFGGIPGYGRFAGALDDVRISQVARYADPVHAAPTPLPAADAEHAWAVGRSTRGAARRWRMASLGQATRGNLAWRPRLMALTRHGLPPDGDEWLGFTAEGIAANAPSSPSSHPVSSQQLFCFAWRNCARGVGRPDLGQLGEIRQPIRCSVCSGHELRPALCTAAAWRREGWIACASRSTRRRARLTSAPPTSRLSSG